MMDFSATSERQTAKRLDEPKMVCPRWSCQTIESGRPWLIAVLSLELKTRAERAFHLVERALLRTLVAGRRRFPIFSQPPCQGGQIAVLRSKSTGWPTGPSTLCASCLASRLLLALMVSGLALALSGCSKRKDETVKADAPAAQPVVVKTALIEQRPVERYVEVVGSLKADQEVVVSSEVKGTIEELPVDLGSVVRRGQLLAKLSQREAQLRVDQAQAALDQARARVGLRSGTSRLEADQNPEVRQAKAALDEARLRYDRAKTLIENGDISQEQFDAAEIQHRSAEARYQAAVDGFHNQTAMVDQRAAELQLARKALQDTVIVAPIDGAVSARHVTRGEYIKAETKIVTLVRSNPLRLQAVVPEVAVASIRLNQPVTLSVDSYPGKTFSGVISRISPSLDEKARTLTLEATVANKDGALKPGLFASVRLLVAKQSPAVMAPSSALLAFAGLTKLYVVEGDRAVERVVKTGLQKDGYVEILEGAKAGERVAVENLGKLSNGAPVKGRES